MLLYLLGVFMWGILSCHSAREFFGDDQSVGNFCAKWCVSQRVALDAGCSTINLGVKYLELGEKAVRYRGRI